MKVTCQKCNKKIDLLDIIISKCRCCNVYCMHHRLDHDCEFDYRALYNMTNNMIKLEDKRIDKI